MGTDARGIMNCDLSRLIQEMDSPISLKAVICTLLETEDSSKVMDEMGEKKLKPLYSQG